MKSGLYYKTRNRPPVEIPASSLTAQRSLMSGPAGDTEHDHAVWLGQSCREYVLFSEQYDFTISLLHIEDPAVWPEADEEAEEDAYDRIIRRKPGQSWLG